MYVGDYLSDNLGHEAINLFKADNGRHYLYLNSSGNLPDESTQGADMLLVRFHSTDTFEIIALARNLQIAPGAVCSMPNIREKKPEINSLQTAFIQGEPGGGVTYGGVSVLDIYAGSGQQNVFITYTADSVRLPRPGLRLFIRYEDKENHVVVDDYSPVVATDEAGGQLVTLTLQQNKMPKTSLRSYIRHDTPIDNDNLHRHIIADDSLWASDPIKKAQSVSEVNRRPVSIFDVCLIHSSETCFTNALCYFINQERYRPLWKGFFSSRGIDLDDSLKALREVSLKVSDKQYEGGKRRGRIDLLLRDSANIVVIENKLHSDINSVAADQNDDSQLDRYYDFIHWAVKESVDYKGLNPRFFILSPNYNIPERKTANALSYDIITYGELYAYLAEHLSEFADDPNLLAFYHTMFRHTLHTVNAYLEHEMNDTFHQRIHFLNKQRDNKQ